MESNWRFNVWRYGEEPDRWDLIARLLPNPGPYALLGRSRLGNVWQLWLSPEPLPGYAPTWTHYFNTGANGFPYGIPVEPD